MEPYFQAEVWTDIGWDPLVAKEYVAAQDPSNPGVLILSQFAGAAEELDGAIIVNPYDIEAITEAINISLKMSSEEKLHRWVRMIEQINEFDIHKWSKNCIKAIESIILQNLLIYSRDGAGDGNRTHVFSLEGCCSTIELHPLQLELVSNTCVRCVAFQNNSCTGCIFGLG